MNQAPTTDDEAKTKTRSVRLKKTETHWRASLISGESFAQEKYAPYQIPPDWNLAEVHAQARRVATEKKDVTYAEVCPCCGYEVNRDDIDVCQDIDKLNFMGSGFPMFYNFFLYCIFILFEFFLISGIFNLVTNLMGDECERVRSKELGHSTDTPICQTTLAHITSMANQENEQFLYYQSMIKLLEVCILIITLLLFRRSQRDIHNSVDESQLSPSDYSIIIKNIPTNLEVNYYEELSIILQHYAVPGERLRVRNVSLVYNTEDIFKIESKIKGYIKAIQQILEETNMNFQDVEVLEFWDKIKECEEQIDMEIFNILQTPNKFVGIAIVSFETEKQKSLVLRYNKSTWRERVKSFFRDGKTEQLKDTDLQWEDQKLFCEQAPEPNEIDWESIHISTKEKIKLRVGMNCVAILCMGIFFSVVFILSYLQDIYAGKALQDTQYHELSSSKKFAIISWIINMVTLNLFTFSNKVIVFFNKFIVGLVFHHICDHERVSTQTRFNISFAIKNSLALFFNTAIMSFIIDILCFQNVLGSEGFIYNETILFILNSFFSPFIWLIDPWVIQWKFKYTRERSKGDKSVLTQQEAHLLAERPSYSLAKRYADIIKTLWTAFLYGSVLPLGIFYSLLGLSLYYCIDKYNLVNRRTVKELLGKELALVMTDFMEWCVVFMSLGDLTFRYIIKGHANFIDYLCLLISLVYICLPKNRINELLFPIINQDEMTNYEDAYKEFDTDYDRENPVTRKAALKEWRK